VGTPQLKVSLNVAGSSRPISNVAAVASQAVSQWQVSQAGTYACGIDAAGTKLVTSLSITLTMGLRDTSAAGGICAAVGSGAATILKALLPNAGAGDSSSVSGRWHSR
jgi:hypothetical protein